MSHRHVVIARRRFIVDLGRGVLGLAVVGLAACGPDRTSSPALTAGGSTPAGTAGTSPGAGATTGASAPPSESAGGTAGASPAGSGGAVAWHRVDLGFVSAYVLVRGGEAAVVDTGAEGSSGDIETVLGDAGLGWDTVAHVILTHRHPDHVGSLPDVLAGAPAADTYAGAEDIPAIAAPRAISAVADGDDVFGLTIVTTPGHTAGHISVYDPAGGILVAGDALTTSGGKAAGPNAQFTDDMATAEESVRKLAALTFETLLVGHGDPVESGADAQVAALVQGG